MNDADIPLAYCGAPPSMETLAGRWLLDPWVIGALAVMAAAYGWRARGRIEPGHAAAFYAGWMLTALALLSPLCALSVSLFSARVGQHLVLLLLAAPLVAAGRPLTLLGAREGAPLTAAAVFAATLWLWHSPGPYAATFANGAVYWLMHVSTFASAVWLWSALRSRSGSSVQGLLAGLFSTVQMGLLGALITFAPHALYAPHRTTTLVWGLTPLDDQQLGGALMWGPGCAVFVLAAIVAALALLRDDPAPTANLRRTS